MQMGSSQEEGVFVNHDFQLFVGLERRIETTGGRADVWRTRHFHAYFGENLLAVEIYLN